MTPSPIASSRLVPAPPDTVFRYLEDLAHHEGLAPHAADLMTLCRRPWGLDRAIVRLRGPLGLRRTATTELVRTEPPRLLVGRAMLGSRTTASVTWTISSALDSLAAQMEYERGLSPSPGAGQRVAPWPTTAATASPTLPQANYLRKESQ
jgi:hypothetical protein